MAEIGRRLRGAAAPSAPALPDELRLRRARRRLAEFGTLWRDPVIPDRLREEALHEIFARVDVQGSQLLAVHPQPNENAWLLGLAALRQEQHVGMVGARGLGPPIPTSVSTSSGSCRIEQRPLVLPADQQLAFAAKIRQIAPSECSDPRDHTRPEG